MQCPRCKMEDVYLSTSGNSGVISLLTKVCRCHRCCHLFKVARWKHVPEKSELIAADGSLARKSRVA